MKLTLCNFSPFSCHVLSIPYITFNILMYTHNINFHFCVQVTKKNNLPAGQRRPLSLPGYSWSPWPSGPHHSYREGTDYHMAHISEPGTCSSVSERTVYWIVDHSNKKVREWPLCGITLPHRQHKDLPSQLLQQQVRPSLSVSLSVPLEPILTCTN